QLIREAEEGMQQLTAHVATREPLIAQRAHSTHSNQQVSRTAPQPVPRTKPTPTPQVITQRTNTNIPMNRPASQAAPPTSTQPAPESMPTPNEHNGHANERTNERPRQNGSVGMTLPSGENGSLSLPQFIQYIKVHMDLTPKQAMDILNVKSLTTGINLRDALEQLKERTSQHGSTPAPAEPVQQRSNGSTVSDEVTQHEPTRASNAASPSGQRLHSGPLPQISKHEPLATPLEIQTRRPVVGFDEEIGPEDLEEPDDLFDGAHSFDGGELEDLEELPGDQFSPKELEQAQEKIEALRAIQGATTVTEGRLKVLNNVVVGQITEEQLLDLIRGVWNITAVKKLKVDQVEELISWAKREDAFIEQVEAILAVLG
ncbi:MAG: hypothetical protein JO031_05190, partial [Ktedonobacteraceae bacterium]|nr:hypothetical protein [Ktedonobacteraceae bacterium]